MTKIQKNENDKKGEIPEKMRGNMVRTELEKGIEGKIIYRSLMLT